VTRDTRDQDFAANRQLFLTEQGYRYEILSHYDPGANRRAGAQKRPKLSQYRSPLLHPNT
jgi:hypothetical protein